VSEVCLLVELGLLETESVDNVDLGLLLVVALLLTALGGSVGTSVEGLTTDGDLGAVGLVSHTVNLLEVVRVGDELVTADDVLRKKIISLVFALRLIVPLLRSQSRGTEGWNRYSRCR
jgi:hypothetical protein